MYNTFEEVARRYATAIFYSAKEQNKLDVITSNMQSLASIFKISEDMRRAVRIPGIKPEEFSAVLREVCKQIEADKIIINFTQLLCIRKRVFMLPNIIRHFQAMMSYERGEIQAIIFSAKKLNIDQVSILTEALQPFAHKTQDNLKVKGKVTTNIILDKELIGGFKILMGAHLIDLSIKSRLEAIHTNLSKV